MTKKYFQKQKNSSLFGVSVKLINHFLCQSLNVANGSFGSEAAIDRDIPNVSFQPLRRTAFGQEQPLKYKVRYP